MVDIIFCGFGSLALSCIKVLKENNYTIKAILTHDSTDIQSVKAYAIEHNIKYYLEDLRKSQDIHDKLLQFASLNNISYLISINYRYIIPTSFFSHFSVALNLHGALLPHFRGRTPHVWAIINGQKECGVTCHKIAKIVDSGDIIEQVKVAIEDNDTGYSLLKKLEKHYPIVLLKALDKINKGFKGQKQNEDEATYFGVRTPIMGYISFNNDFYSINNFVRAQAHPYPGAYYYLGDGRKIIINKIQKAKSIIPTKPIGQIFINADKYLVFCKDCLIEIVDYTIL